MQKALDGWREIYNHERPHEGIGLEVPASRYRASVRAYPEVLPPIEYDTTDLVRTVRSNGRVQVGKSDYFIGEPFAGQPVALRAAREDGMWDVFFCHERIATVDRYDAVSTKRG